MACGYGIRQHSYDRLSTQGQRPYFLVSVLPVPTTEPGTEQDSGFTERIITCLSIYKHVFCNIGKWFHPTLQPFWIFI